MKKSNFKFIVSFVLACFLATSYPFSASSAEFNPNFIISDEETQDAKAWGKDEIKNFLQSKGSFLSNYITTDFTGVTKPATDIIYEAAQNYQINPKFLLVTLQKEQSLITDDSPTQKQLNWAAGYAVCDSCSMDDPAIQSHKGFGMQVDNAAGIMRWYYDNKDRSIVKKKDQPITIDNTQVVPQSWATAFLYTYTPHLHGNSNFWRIWNTWFQQFYPNGTLLYSASTTEYWLVQDNARRKFKNVSTLVSRLDPKTAITVSDVDLNNFKLGPEISFSNYSILKAGSTTYLLDYDTLRPFASDEVVRAIGYNPQEIIEVSPADIVGYKIGAIINASTTAPTGVIYQITDQNNVFYLLKDGELQPLLDGSVVKSNYRNLPIEKHKTVDLTKYTLREIPLTHQDGTLLQADNGPIFVMESGKKRRLADQETFSAMGYKKTNILKISVTQLINIPEGEKIYLNSNLLSAKNKFLGDSEAVVTDMFGSKLPAYLVAEYPSGRIISGKNIDQQSPIGSITKLLTAYETLSGTYNPATTVTYSEKKFALGTNKLKLKEGDKITAENLLKGMLIGSANAAARMLPMAIGETEETAVSNINDILSEWGADNTTITDTSGWDAGNISSPRDLLKIFTKIRANDKIKELIFETEGTIKKVSKNKVASNVYFKNTNELLAKSGRNYRILGSKTGYTDEGGATLVMLVESRKTKKQYLIVTLGNRATNRFDEPGRIATWIAKGDVKIATK